MEIERLVQRGLILPREVSRIPIGVIGGIANFGLETWKNSVEVFLPSESQQALAEHREVEDPIKEFEIGMQAVHSGERRQDPELEFFGGAMAVKGVVLAYESPRIPPRVTSRLVNNMLEANIIPEEQPLVSDELVERAHPPIRKYGNAVLQIFPSIKK